MKRTNTESCSEDLGYVTIKEETLEELLLEGLAREASEKRSKKTSPKNAKQPFAVQTPKVEKKLHHGQRYRVRFKPPIEGKVPKHAMQEFGEETWTVVKMKFEDNEYVEFTNGTHETQQENYDER